MYYSSNELNTQNLCALLKTYMKSLVWFCREEGGLKSARIAELSSLEMVVSRRTLTALGHEPETIVALAAKRKGTPEGKDFWCKAVTRFRTRDSETREIKEQQFGSPIKGRCRVTELVMPAYYGLELFAHITNEIEFLADILQVRDQVDPLEVVPLGTALYSIINGEEPENEEELTVAKEVLHGARLLLAGKPRLALAS